MRVREVAFERSCSFAAPTAFLFDARRHRVAASSVASCNSHGRPCVRYKTRTAHEMAQAAINNLHGKHKMRPDDEGGMVIRFADRTHVLLDLKMP